MANQAVPAVVRFTMSVPEVHQHVRNLESAAESAAPAEQEALTALLLVLRRELDKAESHPA
jgi:hypothetical protein